MRVKYKVQIDKEIYPIEITVYRFSNSPKGFVSEEDMGILLFVQNTKQVNMPSEIYYWKNKKAYLTRHPDKIRKSMYAVDEILNYVLTKSRQKRERKKAVVTFLREVIADLERRDKKNLFLNEDNEL